MPKTLADTQLFNTFIKESSLTYHFGAVQYDLTSLKTNAMDNLELKMDALFAPLTQEQQEDLLDNQFAYIFVKAYKYLETDPVSYREADYFKMPLATLTAQDLAIIKSGCEQIIEGKGFSENTPLINIGVSGFYNLMHLFHFRSLERKTKHGTVIGKNRGAMDCMVFKHAMDERKAKLYNFVSKRIAD